MKIIRSTDLKYIPASHEDQRFPGVLKKVLLVKDDLVEGRTQMINWALLPVGKSFEAHYHEDMQEVFIILNGYVKIIVDNEEADLSKGDAVVIPLRSVHEMKNTGTEDVEYIAIGISLGQQGKTVVLG